MIHFNAIRNSGDFLEWKMQFEDITSKLNSLFFNNTNALNFSSSDFAHIENYIFCNFTYKTAYEDEELEILNYLHYYIGEIFIKEIKCAAWGIELENKKDFFYKIPTIVLSNKAGSPISPFNLIATSLYYGNEKDVLKRVFENLSKKCT